MHLGTCCACGENLLSTPRVVCLNLLAPIAGTGWGNALVDVPNNGAIALVCDRCHEEKRKLRWVCFGAIANNRRRRISQVTQPFAQDLEQRIALIGEF